MIEKIDQVTATSMKQNSGKPWPTDSTCQCDFHIDADKRRRYPDTSAPPQTRRKRSGKHDRRKYIPLLTDP